MGSIHQVENQQERLTDIAADYVKTISERKGKTFKEALVVAPTHKEGEMVTDKIRERLKAAGKLGNEEKPVTRLRNLNLTEAQRKDAINFQPGQVVEFNQNVKGFKAGEKFTVHGRDEQGQILVKAPGQEKTLPLPTEQAAMFQLYSPQAAAFATGDRLRITKNGKAMGGNKLNNGQIYSVTGFDKEGNIRLSNGTTLNKDFGHVTHGYAVTSNASQGKTVDKVIVAQSSYSFGASTREQFYVSVSRGKEAVAVYTDNKADLQDIVTNRSSERMAAYEVANSNAAEKKIQTQQVLVNRLQALSETYATWRDKVQTFKQQTVDKLVNQASKLAANTPLKSFTQTQNPVTTHNGTQRATPKR